MKNCIILLLLLPFASSVFKAEFPQAQNKTWETVEIPTLEDLYYSFYDEMFEFNGERMNIHDTLKKMKEMIKTMEQNLKTSKRHYKKMELMQELSDITHRYELDADTRKIDEDAYLRKMSNLLFRIATTDSVPVLEKLELFFSLIETYPFFTELTFGAMDVATEFSAMTKHLTKVSERVKLAYLIALRITMAVDSPTVEDLEDKLDEILAVFTAKEHEEMTMISKKALENKEIRKALASSSLLDALRETLKY